MLYEENGEDGMNVEIVEGKQGDKRMKKATEREREEGDGVNG